LPTDLSAGAHGAKAEAPSAKVGGQRSETTGGERRARADEVAKAQALARRAAFEEGGQEAAVERITGASGVDDAHPRRRLGDVELGLYGKDPYETSRIDSFLDASLVFARDSQIYLLALGSGSLSEEIYHRTREAFAVYMAGINSALSAGRGFIVGDCLTLADVCFVAELALFHNEKPRAQDLKKRGLEPILSGRVDEQFPDATAHFARLSKHPAFAPDVDPYMEKIERATV